MKSTVIIWTLSAAIIALLIVSTAHGQEITDAELDAIPRADIAKTVKHLQSLVRESGARADAAELLLSEQRDRLTFTQTQLATTQASAAALEKHDGEQTSLANKYLADAEKWHKESDRRGNILGVMGAALLGYVGFNLMGSGFATWILGKICPTFALAKFAFPLIGTIGGYFLARWVT